MSKKIISVVIPVLIITICAGFSVCAYGASEMDLDYEHNEYYYEKSYNSDESLEFNIGKNILIALAVGLVLALIITGIMRSKMKSVRYENAARNYIKQNSMKVLRSNDLYLYSHVTKRAKPKDNNKRKS